MAKRKGNARVEQSLEQEAAPKPNDGSAIEMAPAGALVVAVDGVEDGQDGSPDAAEAVSSSAGGPHDDAHGSGGFSIDSEAPAGPEDAFQCEACDKVIEPGDKVCDLEDGGVLCEDCAPKWGEVLERPAAFDVSAAEAREMVDKHLGSGGSLDDPYVGYSAEDANHLADAMAYMLQAESTMKVKRGTALEMGQAKRAAYTSLAAPIAAAEAAAYAAMEVAQLHHGPVDGEYGLRLLPDDDLAKYVCGLKEAADFIREGGASTDGRIFWNHLSLGGFHAAGLNNWQDLPFALRLGWSAFGAVLLAYDVFTAEDNAKATKVTPPARRVPIEDTTLERVDGVLDQFDYGRKG